jgi:hypothetical protein
MKPVVIAAVSILLLSGCASAPRAAPTASTTPTAAPAASYKTVEDLRDAFVKAGGDCPSWEESNNVTLAAQSGDCSGKTVLSIYLSEASRDQVIVNLKGLDIGVHLLVGDNWIINTPDPAAFADELAGTVVTSAG